jgi:hypothetical protein
MEAESIYTTVKCEKSGTMDNTKNDSETYSKFGTITQCKHYDMKLSLYLIHSAAHHEEVWGSGGAAPPFLTSTLDQGEWSGSCPKEEAMWAPEPIQMLGGREQFLSPARIQMQLFSQ